MHHEVCATTREARQQQQPMPLSSMFSAISNGATMHRVSSAVEWRCHDVQEQASMVIGIICSVHYPECILICVQLLMYYVSKQRAFFYGEGH